MPNTGKPSKNCHLCRQRRVKCDLGQPGCRRCVKYGVECPGYRDEQDLVWHNANASNIGRKSKKKTPPAPPVLRKAVRAESGSKPCLPSSPSDADSTSDQDAEKPSDTGLAVRHLLSCDSQSVPLGVYESWTTHSIPLVISCYSSIEFLNHVYQDARPAPNECLSLASHLFARTYMATRFKVPDTEGEISFYFSKTLKSIAKAIQDPKRSIDDSTIITVWLLSNYEVLVGGIKQHRDRTTPWHVHAEGMLSLLRARGMSQLKTGSGRRIFWAIFNIILLNCNLTNASSPPESTKWLNFIASTLQPGEGVLLKTSQYQHRASQVYARCTPIEKWPSRASEISDVYMWCVTETDKAELEIIEWMASLPPEQALAETVDSYFWNAWRGARLKLQNLVILMANVAAIAPDCPFPQEELEQRRQLSREIIASTAQEIIDTLPESLGGRGPEYNRLSPEALFFGLRMIWPLSACYMFPTVPRRLRMIACKALERIGKEEGIIQATRRHRVQIPAFAMTGIPEDMDFGLLSIQDSD